MIIDDTPEAVILSCYDPFRREIAKLTIERLIQDGRIHPARIEEMVARAKTEIDQIMKEAAETLTPVSLDELRLGAAGAAGSARRSVQSSVKVRSVGCGRRYFFDQEVLFVGFFVVCAVSVTPKSN